MSNGPKLKSQIEKLASNYSVSILEVFEICGSPSSKLAEQNNFEVKAQIFAAILGELSEIHAERQDSILFLRLPHHKFSYCPPLEYIKSGATELRQVLRYLEKYHQLYT